MSQVKILAIYCLLPVQSKGKEKAYKADLQCQSYSDMENVINYTGVGSYISKIYP